MSSTALEALTAELLGDVGAVHDEIKALRSQAPAIALAIEKVGSQVSHSVRQSVDDAIKELQDAAKSETAAAAEYDSASKLAHQRIARATSEASDAGIAKMKSDFYRISREVLDQAVKDATHVNPNAQKIRATVAVAFMMAIAIGALAGAMVTAMYLNQQPPAAISKEAAVGRAILRAMPVMNETTKNSVARIIEAKS